VGCVALVLAAGCGRAADATGATDPIDAPDAGSSTPLPPVSIDRGVNGGPVEVFLDTYDGSGQSVEPDVVQIPGGWRGFQYWMAINPYPGGNEALENASIFASQDGLAWSVPEGLTNPVVPFPDASIRHNSDPELVYLPDPGRLILFDRAVTNTDNLLRQQISDDGVHWSDPQPVVHEKNHDLVSPTIALVPGRRARLWYVQTGTAGCSARVTTVAVRRWTKAQTGPDALVGSSWSAPVATDLQAPAGYVLWHLDVIWVAEQNEFLAVFPAFRPDEGCGRNDLFVSRSRDGVHWTTLKEPLIRRGVAPFAELSVYRSSLVYDAATQAIKVWFSGLDRDARWHLGFQVFAVTSLQSAIDGQVRSGR